MNIKEREAELLDMLDTGKISWEQYADLYIDAQQDDITYPDVEENE